MDIIDALIVTLGLDASGFKKGQKETQDALGKTSESAKKTQKDIDDLNSKSSDGSKKAAEEERKRQKAAEEANKKLAESYKVIRDSILEMTAAIIGAVAGADFVKFLTHNDIAVSKLATNTGSTTAEVLSLRGAFESMGASADDADGSLRAVNKILTEMKNTGGSEALLGLQMSGANVAKFRSAGSNEERLELLSDALKKRTPQDAQYWGQQAGFSEETINMLIQTRIALKDLFEEQRKMNKLSQEDIDAAFERQHAWSNLKYTFEGMGRQISTEVSPIWVGFMKVVQEFFQYLEDHVPIANGLVLALVAAFGSLTAVSFASLLTKLGALTGGLSATGTAAAGLLGLLSKLGLVGLAGGAGYAIGSWIEDQTGIGATLGSNVYDAIHLLIGDDPVNGPAPKRSGSTSKAGGGTSGTSKWEPLIQSASAKWGVPADLIRAVMQQESKGNPNAVSSRGAAGLMQLMPRTAAGHGVSNAFDPAQNVDGGVHELHDLLAKYGGNVEMALAGYNWGSGNLDKYGFGRRPGETRSYADSIVGNMNASRGRGGSGGTSVSIGDVHVHTSASTMSGAGHDLSNSVLQRFTLASQSDTGLN